MKDPSKTNPELIEEISLLKQRIKELKQSESDREQAEAALKLSEQKYRSIFDNAVEGIYQTTPEGHFLSANPALAQMFGYDTPEELINSITDLSTQSYVNPEDREIFKGILSKKGVVEKFETRLRKKGGEIIWVSINAYAVKAIKGNIYSYEGIIEDITERKWLDSELLRAKEENFRNVFDNAGDGILLADIGSKKFYMGNRAICQMLGYSPEEIKDLGIMDIHPEKDLPYVVDQFERQAKGEFSLSRDLPIQRKDGTVLYADVNATHITFAGKKYLMGFFHDITERKHAEEKLRKNLIGTIKAISLTVETRDHYTAGHQKRASNLARTIAQEMGLSNDTVDTIRMAGIIHDLGKIAVPAEILSKPTKLTGIEFSLIKVHPQAGYDILKDVDLPYPIAEIVLQHHERLDGSGYPQGLKGDQILLEAKILTVADVVEAMASHRPYRPAKGIDAALEEIEKNKGIFYDVKAVDACVRLFREKGFTLETKTS